MESVVVRIGLARRCRVAHGRRRVDRRSRGSTADRSSPGWRPRRGSGRPSRCTRRRWSSRARAGTAHAGRRAPAPPPCAWRSGLPSSGRKRDLVAAGPPVVADRAPDSVDRPSAAGLGRVARAPAARRRRPRARHTTWRVAPRRATSTVIGPRPEQHTVEVCSPGSTEAAPGTPRRSPADGSGGAVDASRGRGVQVYADRMSAQLTRPLPLRRKVGRSWHEPPEAGPCAANPAGSHGRDRRRRAGGGLRAADHQLVDDEAGDRGRRNRWPTPSPAARSSCATTDRSISSSIPLTDLPASALGTVRARQPARVVAAAAERPAPRPHRCAPRPSHRCRCAPRMRRRSCCRRSRWPTAAPGTSCWPAPRWPGTPTQNITLNQVAELAADGAVAGLLAALTLADLDLRSSPLRTASVAIARTRQHHAGSAPGRSRARPTRSPPPGAPGSSRFRAELRGLLLGVDRDVARPPRRCRCAPRPCGPRRCAPPT